MHGCVKKEGKIMKVYAIRNYGTDTPAPKMNRTKRMQAGAALRQDEPKADTVAFKGNKNMLKGAGIGALCGLGFITLISGGLATPLAAGLYAAAMGGTGAAVGNVLDKTSEKNNDEKD